MLVHMDFRKPVFDQSLWLAICIVWVFSLSSSNIEASVVSDIYTIEVPVKDQSSKNRSSAFRSGLKQVLYKIVGDRDIAASVKLPNASGLVDQYQYRELSDDMRRLNDQKSKESPEKSTELDTQMIWIRFNENKVEQFIKDNALPVWDKLRLDSVLWIAVKDGVNRYVLKQREDSVLKNVVNLASHRRALPVIWPQIEAVDQVIRFADVWSGLEKPLRDLTDEYSKGPIINGKLLWNGRQWNSEWSVFVEDNKVQWNLDDTNYDELLTKAIDKAADAIGREYAIFESDASKVFHALSIEVDNINSILSLDKLKQYLLSLPQVEEAKLIAIDNTRVYFDLTIKDVAEPFLTTVKKNSVLQLVDTKEQLQTDQVTDIPATQFEVTHRFLMQNL